MCISQNVFVSNIIIGKKWSFEGYVAGFTTSADVGDAITFEATIIVTGQAVLEGNVSAG